MFKNSILKKDLPLTLLKQKDEGFTIIEVLMVAVIVLLLSAIVLPSYKSIKKQFALLRSVSKLSQDIRRIQEMTMSAEEFSACLGESGYKYGYGIFLNISVDSTTYILFADCDGSGTYNSNKDKTLEIKQVEEGIQITDVGQVNFLAVTFTSPDPAVDIWPSAPAEITLTDGIQSEIIRINEAGLISVD